tara:strand:- start:110076 stop:111002 length:927 start_codon:yes stop_codon:yes gene_type:complete
MNSLWIDADMGFDDMLAIMMVDHSTRIIAGCSLVFGNAPLPQVCKNAASMAATFNWTFPIHIGAAKPLIGELVTAGHVLGPTGLPTLGQALPDAAPLPQPAAALAALVQWLENADGKAELLALGPLTNIAILCLARPDLLPQLQSITWMGGGATSGNHTASAEFNAFADPEAAAIVCASGVPFNMVDLDACRQVTVSPADLIGLRKTDTPKAALLHDLFGGYINIGIAKGRESMALYDPVAAAPVIDQNALTFQPMSIAVECAGNLTRGRTVMDASAKDTGTTQLGIKANATRIREMALASLLKAATE